MIRHWLTAAVTGLRRAAGDPWIVAGVGLILAGSAMQGVVEQLVDVRAQIGAAQLQLATVLPADPDVDTDPDAELATAPVEAAEP